MDGLAPGGVQMHAVFFYLTVTLLVKYIRSMSIRAYPNLSETLKRYENRWVLLSEDTKKVISDGKTLKEAKKHYKGPINKIVIYKVPSFSSHFISTQS